MKLVRHNRPQLAASMLEAVLTIPIFFFFVLLIVDISRYFFIISIMNWAAQDAVDYASKLQVEKVTCDSSTADCQCASAVNADPEAECAAYADLFNAIASRAEQNVSLVLSSSKVRESKAKLVGFQHYRSDDYGGCLCAGLVTLDPSERNIAFLRPGERVVRTSGPKAGTIFENPLRPCPEGGTCLDDGEDPEKHLGWPKPGESWGKILESLPLMVRMEAEFTPITPVFPELTMEVVQMAYRTPRKAGVGSPAPPGTSDCDADASHPSRDQHPHAVAV